MSRHVSREPVFVVVIAAYNEAATIVGVVTRCLAHVGAVIVVDDGSTDGTADALTGLPIVVLRHARNRGKAASLRLGLGHAIRNGADAAITLDGDGQHEPEDIPRLIAAYVQHSGCLVVGARLHEKENMPRARYWANRFANVCVTWAAGQVYADTQSGFRIYPAAFLHAVLTRSESTRFVFETEMLIEAAHMNVQCITVSIAAIYSEKVRASHFRPVLDVLLIGRMLTWQAILRASFLRGVRGHLRRHKATTQSQTASL